MLQRIISAFVGVIFISPLGFSAESTSNKYQASLILPWSFVSQNISVQDRLNYDFLLNNFTIVAQGSPLILQSIAVHLSAQLQPVLISANQTTSQTHVDTQQLSFFVKIPAFKLQRDLEQVVSGVIVHAHLEAQCGEITLIQNQAQAHSLWSWRTQNQLQQKVTTQLESLDLSWPANSWQIQGLECQGPQGFADLVQAELRKQLAQADQVAAAVKPQLQSILNDKITQSLEPYRHPNWIYQSGSQGFSFQLTGAESISPEALIFDLQLQVWDSSTTASSDEQSALTIDDSILQQVGTNPTILVSKTALQKMAVQMSRWARWDIDLQDISDFKKLMKSRFLQFFAWPDLMNYSKKATFPMRTQLVADPNVQFQQGTEMLFSANVGSWIKSTRSHQLWDYIYLASQISAQANLSIHGGQAQFQFSQQKLKMNTVFGSDYIKKFNPSKSIPLSQLKSAVKSNPYYQSVSYILPNLQIGTVLQANSLKRASSESFLIEWAPAQNK